MKLVVTGGAGFIGSHLVESLVSNKYDVTVVDNSTNLNFNNLQSIKDKIEFNNLDILDYEILKKSLKNADCVFHHAALTSVQDSFTQQQKYTDVNVKGTENIFKIAQEYGFKVIFASSAAIYGNTKQIPIKEESITHPINPYGETKLKSEKLSEFYAKKGVSITGLRYFNVYGPRQNKTYAGVITKFLEMIKNKKPLTIHGDGFQTRDFVFVGDVVEANLLAMKSSVNHALINIGSGIATSINELADMIMQLSGLKIDPIHDDALEGEIRSSQADIGLAKSLLDWMPKTRLESWLEQVIL